MLYWFFYILKVSIRVILRCGVLASLTFGLVTARIPTELEKIQKAGEIHMVSRNGPTTVYEGPDGQTGFEYTLAKKFADHLGVELVIHEQEDLGRMIQGVQFGRYDFAAAGLTATPKRARRVRFATPYLQVTQQLIYRKGQARPQSIEDLLNKKIHVIANSSHVETLRSLRKDLPELSWTESSDLDMIDLLEMVHKGEIDYTLVDSNAFQVNTTLYPEASVAFDLTSEQDLAWAFAQSKDQTLFKEAQRFFKDIHQLGLIDEAIETYYGHLGKLNYSGALVFQDRVNSRLPKWRDLLVETAEKHDLDWQLLAAISYQESHWNPKAKSPTGVRGFMMLTRPTAKEMGVTNRLSAQQSIDGGARYFKKIHARIPDRIAEPDRTWMALAAYNMGLGHLEDARILTEHHGANPDKWSDVRERVLLLEKRQYYKYLTHGYARGSEAYGYVKNIRNFYSILAWNEKEKQERELLAKIQKQNASKMANQQFATLSHGVTEAVWSIAVKSL